MNEEGGSLKEKYPAEEEPINTKEVELNECWNDLQVLVSKKFQRMYTVHFLSLAYT